MLVDLLEAMVRHNGVVDIAASSSMEPVQAARTAKYRAVKSSDRENL